MDDNYDYHRDILPLYPMRLVCARVCHSALCFFWVTSCSWVSRLRLLVVELGTTWASFPVTALNRLLSAWIARSVFEAGTINESCTARLGTSWLRFRSSIAPTMAWLSRNMKSGQ